MMLEVPYGITRRLPGATFAQAKARVTEALKAEGFGVLTEIDVQATLKQKIGVDMAPYVILGACNPKLAHQALEREPAIGLLLPCNVVVAQDGNDVVVSAASPRSMFRIAEGVEGLADTAEDAEARLRRAIEALSLGPSRPGARGRMAQRASGPHPPVVRRPRRSSYRSSEAPGGVQRARLRVRALQESRAR